MIKNYICKNCHTPYILDIGCNDVKPIECSYGDESDCKLIEEEDNYD